MVISMEKVTIYPSLSVTVLVCAYILAVIIKMASLYSPKCPNFGHPICKRNFRKVI